MGDSMWLQDVGVGAVGGLFAALLILYRLVGPSDAAYERVPASRRWRIIGLCVVLGAVLIWLYGLVRSQSTGFDISVGAVGGLFVALLILWRIGSSDAAYARVPMPRRWGILGICVALGAGLMWLYGWAR